jgi:hypothetical protein
MKTQGRLLTVCDGQAFLNAETQKRGINSIPCLSVNIPSLSLCACASGWGPASSKMEDAPRIAGARQAFAAAFIQQLN